MINFENLDKCTFPGVGKYDMPQIDPVTEYPQGDFIHIGDATREKHPEDKIVHCFVDDYRFVRQVAPPQGAWVEIIISCTSWILDSGRSPHGERGLKLRLRIEEAPHHVAPAGVWVEISTPWRIF